MKPPEVPRWLQNIDGVGLEASSCWCSRGWLLAGAGAPRPAERDRLLCLERGSQSPVLVTFTPPQPLRLWLCGKSCTEAPAGEEGRGGGVGGRVTDKVNLFPQLTPRGLA